MVVTEKATFMHLPKSGGTFVKQAIRSQMIRVEDHALPHCAPEGNPIFGFIRNPWHWYTSWFNFVNKGSDMFKMVGFECSTLAMRQYGNVGFEEFVGHYCMPSQKFKNKAFKIAKTNFNNVPARFSNMQVAGLWAESDDSYYKHLRNVFLTGCDELGRVETLNEDLKGMLKSVDMLTPQLSNHIDEQSNCNVGKYDDYTKFWTQDSIDMVYEVEKDYIEKYGYRFGE